MSFRSLRIDSYSCRVPWISRVLSNMFGMIRGPRYPACGALGPPRPGRTPSDSCLQALYPLPLPVPGAGATAGRSVICGRKTTAVHPSIAPPYMPAMPIPPPYMPPMPPPYIPAHAAAVHPAHATAVHAAHAAAIHATHAAAEHATHTAHTPIIIMVYIGLLLYRPMIAMASM